MYSRLRKHFGRVNGDFGQTRVRESRLSSKTNDGQRKLAWGMRKDGRLTSSPGPVVINKEANTEEQRLIRQLQSATEERNELRDLLTYVTERYRNNSNLPSRIHMDKICMQKKLFPFKESKTEHLDCAPLVQKYLVDLHKKDKDEQEKKSNLQTQPRLDNTT
ncbi:uncharacterized protein LOC134478815 isoform X2 [Rattus norvegicus]|uniref:uncharacterized protein LOC134478815 isoform X2 n=1 Tax=Rattus norvegicus TaxID=10116 RepID=UPI00081019E5|nr:uncharacterized protein LOC103693048 isoform X6 [Rattus norvegicus]|eukprot:XP_017451500.1 PREDICTED: uncharacterized protein LOC103690606 isoform X2 [Rattus norvegicus]